jgi:simple sugar transport system permease protein
LHKSFSLSGMPIAAVPAEVGGALFAGLTLALCILTWAMLRASVAGFVIRTTGGNALAAKLSGVSVGSVWFRVGLFAGGCAGLAGAALVAGFSSGPQGTLVTGAGYGGIAVALLAQGSPVRILYWAPAVAIVARFADVIARASSLPSSTVDLVTAALIVIGLIATSIGQGRRHRRAIPS